MGENSSKTLETNKIVLLGMSNAGKTSIIKSLTREFKMLANLQPTQGIERNSVEILGNSIIFWDFGGQDIYRNKYLKNPERFFVSISYIFYVIDVQDRHQFEENKNYFEAVIKESFKYSPKAQLILLFHKLDPLIEDKSEMEKNKQEFLDFISPTLENYQKSLIEYETSIYNVLSIIKAFSKPLIGKDDIYTNVTMALESFCTTYHLEFTILFTKNFFEIGHYTTDSISADQIHEMLHLFFGKFDENAPYSVLNLTYEGIQIINSKYNIRFGKSRVPFYLALGFSDAKSTLNQDGLKDALTMLNENLQKLFMNIDLSGLMFHLFNNA
jgi:Ras-related GTP-binding protein A/B